MKRTNFNLTDNGFIGSKEVYGESNKRYNVGVGYRYNRPFGSVAPIKDYDYIVQRNKGGEVIGLFSQDVHENPKLSATNLGSRIRKTAIMKDIDNVKKRRG